MPLGTQYEYSFAVQSPSSLISNASGRLREYPTFLDCSGRSLISFPLRSHTLNHCRRRLAFPPGSLSYTAAVRPSGACATPSHGFAGVPVVVSCTFWVPSGEDSHTFPASM